MSHARIFQKPKSAMQSGHSGTDRWVLEFQPTEAKKPDLLTGWAGSGDTRGQISLRFPTLDAANAYAAKNNITATVIPAPVKILKLQAYADNFR